MTAIKKHHLELFSKPAPTKPVREAKKKHIWISFYDDVDNNMTFCKSCGIIKRADDNNSPCRKRNLGTSIMRQPPIRPCEKIEKLKYKLGVSVFDVTRDLVDKINEIVDHLNDRQPDTQTKTA